MQSGSMFFTSTGFIEDSETSSMMLQYGPSWASVEEGSLPSASCIVASFLAAGGWLWGE